MWVQCSKCRRSYDDANQWTICPHGPLWAAPEDYCPDCDLVNCQRHKGSGTDQPREAKTTNRRTPDEAVDLPDHRSLQFGSEGIGPF